MLTPLARFARSARAVRLIQTLIAFLLVPAVVLTCSGCGGGGDAEAQASEPAPLVRVQTTAEAPSAAVLIGTRVMRPGAGQILLTLEGIGMFCERMPVGANPTFALHWQATAGELVIAHGEVPPGETGRWLLSSVSGETVKLEVFAYVISDEAASCALEGVELGVDSAGVLL